ncbi:MAG: hypothetical protein H0V67_12600 [Geodermatophilaceae bacterium]|nr:hypothetical protein [Geodermatophilaceae bacterium]
MLARHDTDVVSLVFGTLFLAAALLWGLADDVQLPAQDWYLPVLLIVVGGVGLLSARTSRQRHPQDSNHP